MRDKARQYFGRENKIHFVFGGFLKKGYWAYGEIIKFGD
jgi:hypothetical protein